MIARLAALALITLMAATSAQAATVCDGAIVDSARQNRRIPVRMRLPAGPGPHPVILFSHGLGGSLDAGTRWAIPWADEGFAVIHLQHPGSDASLWKGLKGAQALGALRQGMTPAQFLARIGDVRAVLDRIGTNSVIANCPLASTDRSRIGIAGHSFGAQTAQAVAGQQFRTASGLVAVSDPRIRAAIALSPAPAAAEPDASAFGKIAIPFLSITGTRDEVPGLTAVSPQDRTRPFHAMPAGNKYLLVLDGADHMVFSGGEQRRAPSANDRRVDSLVQGAGLAFWRRIFVDQDAMGALPAPNGLGERDVWLTK